MKLISCATLGLIFCSFNVESSANGVANALKKNSVHYKIDYATQLSREQVQEESLLSSIARFFGRRGSTVNDNKTKFTNLNIDCLLLILEYLDFDDLLNVAQINDQFSTLAADVFHRKYSHLQIVIRDNFPMPSEPYELLNVAGVKINTDNIERIFKRFGLGFSETTPIEVSETQIELVNYGQIVNTFKHFGHVIKRFKSISFLSFEPLQSQLIGKMINKYSCGSLVDVEFVYRSNKLLEQLKNPMINVENVTFKDMYMLRNQTPRLHELFPAVRRLNLDYWTGNLHTYYHMPNLEHVSLQGTTLSDESSCMDLIMNNPQIQSINLYRAKPKFLQKANIFLPQLKTLALSHFELPDGCIQFENVTTFVLDLGYYTSPKNLHFPRLQTLQIDYKSRNFDDWLDFVNEHNQLRNLHLKHYEMDDSQFLQITANLSDLVEMTLDHRTHSYEDSLSTNSILEMLQSHGNLNKFSINFYPTHIEEALQDYLQRDWDTTIYDVGRSFVRKVSRTTLNVGHAPLKFHD